MPILRTFLPIAFGYRDNAIPSQLPGRQKNENLKRTPGSVSKPPSKLKLSPPTVPQAKINMLNVP